MQSANCFRMFLLPMSLLVTACGSVAPTSEGSADEPSTDAPETAVSVPEETPDEGDSEVALAPEQEVEEVKEESPEPVAAVRCDELTDEQILAAVYDGPKVPEGYYSDLEDEENAWPTWGNGCAESLASAKESAQKHATSNGWKLTGKERTTDLFFETDMDVGGGYTVHFRQTRCDYFDGERLGGAPHASAEPLGKLAVYMWYSQWSITGGYNVVSGAGRTEGGMHSFTMCKVETTYGDCGACDQIVLLESTYGMDENGVVKQPEGAQPIRVIQGQCDQN